MKKILILLIALCTGMSMFAISQLEKYTDLRYGMTKDQVEAVVKSQGATVDSYFHSRNFKPNLNFNGDSWFQFTNGRLSQFNYSNFNLTYRTALENLIAVFGQPSEIYEKRAMWYFPNEEIRLQDIEYYDDLIDYLDGYVSFVELSFKEVKTPASTPAPKPAPPAQPALNGDITLHGYTYKWDDYYGNSHERDNGTFTLEYRGKNHYLGANFNKHVTNITGSHKNRNRWTTRYGKIKINLPKGVKVNKNDEIICWEDNDSSGNKTVVLFIWTPSTNQFQCVKTYDRYWDGRKLHDISYFRTTDATAWSKIQPVLMRELPYCATLVN